MGIPTLISTATASDAASVAITSGIDSTYDEYMFVFTDIHPSTDGQGLSFQVNGAGESGYNETFTDTLGYVSHKEDDSATGGPGLDTGADAGQGTGNIYMTQDSDTTDALASISGILHLFSPSSTTYVKHFYSNINQLSNNDRMYHFFTAGYINTTTAIDDIKFYMGSGTMDTGTIQMYGIA